MKQSDPEERSTRLPSTCSALTTATVLRTIKEVSTDSERFKSTSVIREMPTETTMVGSSAWTADVRDWPTPCTGSVWEGRLELEFSYTAVTNAKSHNPVRKLFGNFLKSYPVISLLGIYPREMEASVRTKTCMQMILKALFIIPPKSPNAHQRKNA